MTPPCLTMTSPPTAMASRATLPETTRSPRAVTTDPAMVSPGATMRSPTEIGVVSSRRAPKGSRASAARMLRAESGASSPTCASNQPGAVMSHAAAMKSAFMGAQRRRWTAIVRSSVAASRAAATSARVSTLNPRSPLERTSVYAESPSAPARRVPAASSRPARIRSASIPTANNTASKRSAIHRTSTLITAASDPAPTPKATRPPRDEGTRPRNVSSAATCHGTKILTRDSTRSANRGEGARCGRCSSARTVARASSSSPLQVGHFRTCVFSGEVPNPTSPSSSRSISLGSRCRSTKPPVGPTSASQKGFQLGPKMLQSVPQLLPGAVDVGLHRAQGQIEHRRDLLVRPAFHVTQHDARSVLGPEPRDRSLDRRSQLTGFDLLEGRFAPGLYVERRGLDLSPRCRVRRPVDADRVDGPLPQMVDGDVVGDLEQPARELELGPVAIDVVQHLDEAFLRQVLGGIAIPDHAKHEREDRPLVTSQ